MVANTCAKKARLIASANITYRPLVRSMRPGVRLVSSIHEMKKRGRHHRVAVDGQEGNSDRAISETTTNNASPVSEQEKLEPVRRSLARRTLSPMVLVRREKSSRNSPGLNPHHASDGRPRLVGLAAQAKLPFNEKE